MSTVVLKSNIIIFTSPGISASSLSASGMTSTPSPQSNFSSAAPLSSGSTNVNLPAFTISAPSDTVPTPETSVQPTSGGPGSTVVSVTVVRATASREGTSTITTHPASTLSSLVISTSTDSNGSKVIMTPPLVTILSTSTESDGSLVTTTSVVANAQPDHQQASDSGILSNTGAVAGIFSVVGVVFASLVVCVVFCIRRQRRIRQRNKWISGMRPQRPSSSTDDPFHDDNTPPVMRSVDNNTEDAHWDRKGTLTPAILLNGSSHGHHNFDQANASILPDMYPMFHNVTFNQPEKPQLQSIDLTSSMELISRPLSTPSIYPVSLSPLENEPISDEMVPKLHRSVTAASTLPPRPPRSHLRERVKSLDHILPTPPESESSNHPSPVSELRSQDIQVVHKKTILDVRSRLINS